MPTAFVFVLALLAATVGPVGAASCDPAGADAADVAAARGEIATTCDCATATSHGAYTSCAAGVVVARAQNGQLSGACGGYVKRCAARSTCGRPGAVTCCRTSRKGKKTCALKRDASQCKAPNGGSASVSTAASCCDACGNAGGGGGAACGNSVVEEGESCDDPGSIGNTACPHPDGKLRCARPGEAGACDRCCGRSVGDGAGYICLDDSECCGFCARFMAGKRCADCRDAACSCGTVGDVCNDTSCCAGYACQPGAFFATCCGETGTGCGSGGDCCSGTCTAGACE